MAKSRADFNFYLDEPLPAEMVETLPEYARPYAEGGRLRAVEIRDEHDAKHKHAMMETPCVGFAVIMALDRFADPKRTADERLEWYVACRLLAGVANAMLADQYDRLRATPVAIDGNSPEGKAILGKLLGAVTGKGNDGSQPAGPAAPTV